MDTKFQHDNQEILYPAFAFRKGESASIQEDFWMVDPICFEQFCIFTSSVESEDTTQGRMVSHSGFWDHET